MVDQELLAILVCPETKSELEPADEELIARLNEAIQAGRIKNRGGEAVTEPIDGGLIRKNDRLYMYPIRQDIPIMLIDEAIPLRQVS